VECKTFIANKDCMNVPVYIMTLNSFRQKSINKNL